VTYELRIERLIDGSPGDVFDAFVDPETQKFLYGDEQEADWLVESEVDLRVGGMWTIQFGKVGEVPFRETNTFIEVDRPVRLVFASTMFKGRYGGSYDTRVAVTFDERHGKTLLTILQTGFENEDERDMILNGWPAILERLDKLVGSRH